MPSIVVTSALPEDTDAIRSFMERVIKISLVTTPEVRAAMIANVNENVDVWLARQDSCVHLKAMDKDSLVGIILVKDFWNLCSLFVDPAVHRKGIGRILVEAAAKLCRGKSAKNALVLNAAPSAIPFYEQLGFALRESQQHLPPGFMRMHRVLSAESERPGG